MIFIRLFSHLPFWFIYLFSDILSFLAHKIFRYRRRIVLENLRNSFPDFSEKEINSIAKSFYKNLSDIIVETAKELSISAQELSKRIIFKNTGEFEDYLKIGQSVIMLTIHQGNWEWMLHGAASALNIPIDPVYKPLHDKTTDKLIFDIRSQFGSRPLPMAESVKDIIRRRKEFRLFIMVADQSPTRHERGLWTTFMNGEAAFYLGSEILAKMTRFPVLFVQCRRPRRLRVRGWLRVDEPGRFGRLPLSADRMHL